MAWTSTGGENRLSDAFPVVHDSHLKLPLVIPDQHLNPPDPRVTKRIAQRLARDLVNLIPDNGREVHRLSFHDYAKRGNILSGLIRAARFCVVRAIANTVLGCRALH